MHRLCVVTLLILASSFAHAADKVALLIGNSNYEQVPLLYNPVNDVRLIDRALRAHGFDVTRVEDQSLAALNQSLRRFRNKADNAEIAMIYYAGHGIEIGGVNYLIPVDAALDDERDAPGEAVSVASILTQISGAKKLKLMVLDACRDNPFADKIIRANRGRNVGRGLARTTAAASDTMIAYAAAAGAITSDGPRGGNSPFTAAFAKALSGPARDVRLLFGSVRDIMRNAAPDSEPFVYTSLGGSDYLIQERSAPQSVVSIVSRDYERAERIGTAPAWQAFLAQHRESGGLYVTLAEAALAKLEAGSGAVDSEVVVDKAPSEADSVTSKNTDISRLIALAEDGNTSAMARLGWAYSKGENVRQDGLEAIRWYTMAAEQGHNLAMHNLALMYHHGEVVPPNGPAAIKWYKRAIEAGDFEANYGLGLIYYDGELAETDRDAAFGYFHQGATQGDPDAMYMLAVLYDDINGTEGDQRNAGTWLLTALDHGSQFSLGQLTENAGAFSIVARRKIQTHLSETGFYDGAIDGSFGPVTRRALNAYFNAQKIARAQN